MAFESNMALIEWRKNKQVATGIDPVTPIYTYSGVGHANRSTWTALQNTLDNQGRIVQNENDITNLQAQVGGSIKVVSNIAGRDALTGVLEGNKAHVLDDGDGKWAEYIATADGQGNWVKTADQDTPYSASADWSLITNKPSTFPPDAHGIASHNDTSATGAELNTLVGGGETALHSHAAAAAGGGGVDIVVASNAAWPKPEGITKLRIHLIGGGGGGGKSNTTGSSGGTSSITISALTYSAGGGGGGGTGGSYTNGAGGAAGYIGGPGATGNYGGYGGAGANTTLGSHGTHFSGGGGGNNDSGGALPLNGDGGDGGSGSLTLTLGGVGGARVGTDSAGGHGNAGAGGGGARRLTIPGNLGGGGGGGWGAGGGGGGGSSYGLGGSAGVFRVVEVEVPSAADTYNLVVGAGGNGGTTGAANGGGGGGGAQGIVIIEMG